MRALRIALFLGLVAAAGCDSGETPAAGGEAPGSGAATEGTEAAAEGEAAGEAAAEGNEAEAAGQAPAEQAGAANTGGQAAGEVAPDSWENGVYSSPRFNVRFNLPADWKAADEGDSGPAGLGTSDDSITFLGPEGTGLRMVVANSDSIQLVDSSFSNLTETIGFENVRIVPDRSAARTFNGVPGYRTEADALLRGEPVPQYLIAQALELPGSPTMFTLFVVPVAYQTFARGTGSPGDTQRRLEEEMEPSGNRAFGPRPVQGAE